MGRERKRERGKEYVKKGTQEMEREEQEMQEKEGEEMNGI